MDAQEYLDLIFEYADEHPNFDTEFVDSLQEQLDGGRELSAAQLGALENIVEAFRLG